MTSAPRGEARTARDWVRCQRNTATCRIPTKSTAWARFSRRCVAQRLVCQPRLCRPRLFGWGIIDRKGGGGGGLWPWSHRSLSSGEVTNTLSFGLIPLIPASVAGCTGPCKSAWFRKICQQIRLVECWLSASAAFLCSKQSYALFTSDFRYKKGTATQCVTG